MHIELGNFEIFCRDLFCLIIFYIGQIIDKKPLTRADMIGVLSKINADLLIALKNSSTGGSGGIWPINIA